MTRRYHIEKQTRPYTGQPYCGYSSDHKEESYGLLPDAQEAVKRLNKINPVGWNIWDSTTGKLVEGRDFFS